MYPLLILREEMVCLILLVFLLINGCFYKMGKDHGSFLRMCVYAVCHVAFDIVTILTVNNLDTVPLWVNFITHAIFYMSAILFSHEFFCYVVELCYRREIQKKVRIYSVLLPILYLAVLPALPIVYLEGNGSNYSYGMAAYIGYALAMLFFIASTVLVIRKRKKIAPHVRTALIPMLLVMITAECVQIVIPEMLFTGGTAAIITVGFFFSLENPAHVFKQKLMIDALTGVKSRHSYEMDIQRMEEEYRQNPNERYAMVFCDINSLKAVNNNYGHLEGDAYIGEIAQILMKNLRNAENIYRMGGDEFLVVYHNRDEEIVQKEINRIHQECEQTNRRHPYTMSVAIGYAISGEQYGSLRDVLRVADYMMYENKAEIKKQNAIVSADGQKLNITGLTDRIFDAFASTGDRYYLTICNLSTNVSRWSKAAVDYFGLPGEFIFDCLTIWREYIHPDDQADYWADINDVFNGNKKYHDVEYRARNKQGEYVVCTCRGTILRGKNGEPDMFAATVFNHGIAESIDPVTGLHNSQRFMHRVDELIAEGRDAVLLNVSILNFSRINLLYGYTNGNGVLRQFVDIAKRLLGEKGRIFRMEGTCFALCMPGKSANEAVELYRMLQESAHREIRINDLSIPLRLAGGAYMLPKNYEGNSAAVRNNLVYANERSEHECLGRLSFYGDQSMDVMEGNYHLLARIHQDAVADRKGFYLKYQPIVDMDTGKVIGAEALLRWRDERLGEIVPDQFVPWLENDPCFFQLGRWILRRALADAQTLLPICPNFVININVTAFQLEDDRFNSMVLDALRERNFPPSQLCLELTERCREMEFEFLEAQIKFFRSHGIHVALDDVGTGFSSLTVLLRLPVDEIKLDKSFVTDIRTRAGNQIFVRAMVEAAQKMGCQSCLEGVEEEETYRYLHEFGATSYQGYYFSEPLCVEDMRRKILEYGDGH